MPERLLRTVRQTRQNSLTNICYVENVIHGLATVRVGNASGRRITNLSVLGGAVTPGEMAVLDWATGSKPVVRPYSVIEPLGDPVLPPADTSAEEPRIYAPDASVSVYGRETQALPMNEWVTIHFHDRHFDTHSFFNQDYPDYVTIPHVGLYFFTAKVATYGWPNIAQDIYSPGFDWRAFYKEAEGLRWHVELVSNLKGTFGYALGNALDTENNLDEGTVATAEASGLIAAESGERISVRVMMERLQREVEPGLWTIVRSPLTGIYSRTAFPFSPTSGEMVDPIYPVLFGVKVNYRMDQGRDQQILDSLPPLVETSDIEIRDNMGYLRVRDEVNTFARAIANHPNESDYDLTFKFRFASTIHGCMFRVFLRASRDWLDHETPTRGYELYISNTGGWGINRISAGSRTNLGNLNTPVITQWLHMRFNTDGSIVSGKIWLDGEAEPDWQISLTDSSPITDAGALQLGLFHVVGEHYIQIDDLTLSQI